MFLGAHYLMYSSDAHSDRLFLRDVIGIDAIDTGGGWLIFKMPPSEMGVHPTSGTVTGTFREEGREMASAVLYLMCADLPATVEALSAKGVVCGPSTARDWGVSTSFALPSGAHVGLYQPSHPLAI